MKRRDFLQTSVVSGMGLSLSHHILADDTYPQHINHNDFELLEASATELQEQMANGELTSEAICQKYLNRIDKINQQGPAINAVIELNPDALSIARKMDQERKESHVRSPLHGLPVMIKDNIDTGDKMMTTAGSLALKDNKARQDAHIVKLLREAGAVLLGKTNLSEWANFRSTRSSSGWCSRGGQAKNPYVLNRNPCGSSSGSGSGVSANLCVMTIGTETNGSIVCPSSANGIVGIKPTVGLWSRSGIIPISFNQDTAGPMARSVSDAAQLLGLLTKSNPSDSKTQAAGRIAHADYTQFLDKTALKGARIGVARQFFGFHANVDEIMEDNIQAMENEGATLIDVEVIPNIDQYNSHSFEVLLYEFKNGVNEYLARANPSTGVKSLADVIEYNKNHPDQTMPYFGQEILEQAQEKGNLTSEEYLDALKAIHKASREEGIDKVMKENNLDAIIAPTGGPAWTTDLINGDHFGGGSSSPAAWAGYPNISLPAGLIHGLPVGISFFGKAWREPTLIKLAYALEQLTAHRSVPAFKKKID